MKGIGIKIVRRDGLADTWVDPATLDDDVVIDEEEIRISNPHGTYPFKKADVLRLEEYYIYDLQDDLIINKATIK